LEVSDKKGRNKMNTKENVKINLLPAPTWNHLKINDTEYEGASTKEEIFEGLEKVKIEPDDDSPIIYDRVFDGSLKGIDFNFIVNTDSTIILRFNVNDPSREGSGKEDKSNKEGLNVKDNATVKENKWDKDIVIRIDSKIKEGVRFHLVLINLTRNARFYATSNTLCNKESTFLMTSISLGSLRAYLEGKVKLQGESSDYDTYTAYILEKGQFLDMNYVADHIGKNTEAHLVSSGVLNEKTEKTSRQTVNFISGCAGSKGAESEEVLLLDDDVISKSAPLILCTEEDVEGEHGASIGQPDIDVIFYLKSRGIAIEKIYEMLSFAKVEAALMRIDHASTTKMVHDFLGIEEAGR